MSINHVVSNSDFQLKLFFLHLNFHGEKNQQHILWKSDKVLNTCTTLKWYVMIKENFLTKLVFQESVQTKVWKQETTLHLIVCLTGYMAGYLRSCSTLDQSYIIKLIHFILFEIQTLLCIFLWFEWLTKLLLHKQSTDTATLLWTTNLPLHKNWEYIIWIL